MARKGMKEDDHGEYNPNAGYHRPVEKGETITKNGEEKTINWKPCNAVLKYTMERYGEKRYCLAMAKDNFKGQEGDHCKHHQARVETLQQRHQDSVKHGAHVKSAQRLFEYLEPHKQIIAVDLFESLLEESRFEFEVDTVAHVINTSDSSFTDEDEVYVSFPIPTVKTNRAKALWFAALDFIVMENIREEQFRVAAEEDLAIGEKEFEREAESGEVYTVVDEHHLNLDLSRIQKNYKEHMRFGGVSLDGDGEAASLTAREWTVSLEAPTETGEPEGYQTDGNPMDNIDIPDE